MRRRVMCHASLLLLLRLGRLQRRVWSDWPWCGAHGPYARTCMGRARPLGAVVVDAKDSFIHDEQLGFPVSFTRETADRQTRTPSPYVGYCRAHLPCFRNGQPPAFWLCVLRAAVLARRIYHAAAYFERHAPPALPCSGLSIALVASQCTDVGVRPRGRDWGRVVAQISIRHHHSSLSNQSRRAPPFSFELPSVAQTAKTLLMAACCVQRQSIH